MWYPAMIFLSFLRLSDILRVSSIFTNYWWLKNLLLNEWVYNEFVVRGSRNYRWDEVDSPSLGPKAWADENSYQLNSLFHLPSPVGWGWRGQLLLLSLQWQCLTMTSWMLHGSPTWGPWKSGRAKAFPTLRKDKVLRVLWWHSASLGMKGESGDRFTCVLPLNVQAWKRPNDCLIISP